MHETYKAQLMPESFLDKNLIGRRGGVVGVGGG